MEPTYTQLESPCPRCDQVAHLVRGLDLCEACFLGYVTALRQDLALHVIRISRRTGKNGETSYHALCRCGAQPGGGCPRRNKAEACGRAHLKLRGKESRE